MTVYLWTFTCSKSTMETPRRCVKFVRSLQKNIRTMSLMLFGCLYGQLWIEFTHCSDVSIVDLEQESNGWVWCTLQGLWNCLKHFQNLYSQPQQCFKRFFRLVSCDFAFSFFCLAYRSWWQGRYPVQQAAVTTHYWKWQCWCIEI